MYKKIFHIFIFFLLQIISVKAQESVIWNIDRTDSIGGYAAEGLPETPLVVQTSKGKAAMFNGKDQALLVKGNPLGDAKNFTIEVILKPDSSLDPANLEQRFIHVGRTKDAKPRILMEIRLIERYQKWAFDTYLGCDTSSSTLLDSVSADMLHPAGQWYNIAIVYKDHKVTHYIDGVKELQGSLTFLPIPDAQISVGARQNPKSWFKGYIKSIRFTKHALKPAEFLKP